MSCKRKRDEPPIDAPPQVHYYYNYHNENLGCLRPDILENVEAFCEIPPAKCPQPSWFERSDCKVCEPLARFCELLESVPDFIGFLRLVARAYAQGITPFEGLVVAPTFRGDDAYLTARGVLEMNRFVKKWRMSSDPAEVREKFAENEQREWVAMYRDRRVLALDMAITCGGDRWLLGIKECPLEQEITFCSTLLQRLERSDFGRQSMSTISAYYGSLSTLADLKDERARTQEVYCKPTFILTRKFLTHRIAYLSGQIGSESKSKSKPKTLAELAAPWERLVWLLETYGDFSTLRAPFLKAQKRSLAILEEGRYSGDRMPTVSVNYDPLPDGATTGDKTMYVMGILESFKNMLGELNLPLVSDLTYEDITGIYRFLIMSQYCVRNSDGGATSGKGPFAEIFVTFWEVLTDPKIGFFALTQSWTGQHFLVPLPTIPVGYLNALAFIAVACYAWAVPPGISIHPLFLGSAGTSENMFDNAAPLRYVASPNLLVLLNHHMLLADVTNVADPTASRACTDLDSHMRALFYTSDTDLKEYTDCSRVQYFRRMEDRISTVFAGDSATRSARYFYKMWTFQFVGCLRTMLDLHHEEDVQLVRAHIYGVLHGGVAQFEPVITAAELSARIRFVPDARWDRWHHMRTAISSWNVIATPEKRAKFVRFATGRTSLVGNIAIHLAKLEHGEDTFDGVSCVNALPRAQSCIDEIVFPNYARYYRKTEGLSDLETAARTSARVANALDICAEYASLSYGFS